MLQSSGINKRLSWLTYCTMSFNLSSYCNVCQCSQYVNKNFPTLRTFSKKRMCKAKPFKFQKINKVKRPCVPAIVACQLCSWYVCCCWQPLVVLLTSCYCHRPCYCCLSIMFLVCLLLLATLSCVTNLLLLPSSLLLLLVNYVPGMSAVAGDPFVANHLLLPAFLILLLVCYVPGLSAVADGPCVANHLLLLASLLLFLVHYGICMSVVADNPSVASPCRCYRPYCCYVSVMLSVHISAAGTASHCC
jgi:hypothetical protein